jgi:hypothetical protein
MPPHDTVRISASAVDASPDLVDSQSPATYIGYDPVEKFIGKSCRARAMSIESRSSMR